MMEINKKKYREKIKENKDEKFGEDKLLEIK